MLQNISKTDHQMGQQGSQPMVAVDFAARRRGLALQGKIAPVWAIEIWNPLDGTLLEAQGAAPSYAAAYELRLQVGRTIFAHLETRIVRCAPSSDGDGDGQPMQLPMALAA